MPRGARQPSEIFSDVIREAEEALSIASGGAGGFKHTGIRGDERAGTLAAFLEEHLASDFKLGKGEILDFGDRRSGQIDLFIYDRTASAPIITGSESLLLPCEAVYAVIEVKTRLTQDELNKAYVAASAVRRLRPFKKPFIGARTDGKPAKGTAFRCMYVVFAYESNLGEDDWLDKEYDRVVTAAKAASAPLDAIDRIIVLGRGIISPPTTVGRAVAPDDRESAFFEFYIHVANFLNRERLRRPPVDWQAYCARTVPGWRTLG